MIPVLVGVSAAFIFGAADFMGGMGSRRIAAVRVTFMSGVTGLVLMLIIAPLVGGVASVEAFAWGAIAGVSGGVAIMLLYAALAIGPMSILSPLTAVVSAIIPMTWGLATGERLTMLGYLALALALVAVVLVGFVPEKGAVRPKLRGILYAVGSGALIGVFLVSIDHAPADSGLYPLVTHRLATVLVLGAVIVGMALLARRRPTASPTRITGWRAGVAFAIACGALEVTANSLILIGLRLGDLSIMSVLIALYPAGTILLAGIVLRERIAPVQWIGLALALIAAATLGSHRDLSAALGLG